uniref:Fucosyltransferase n=1 Tax=Aegilops tauschii TaxID=37682 RepID=M8B2H2_AEGTA
MDGNEGVCIKEQRLLPELGKAEPAANAYGDGKVKAVMITSLYLGYYDKIRGMYYENPTKRGEIVAVYQPTHEEKQDVRGLVTLIRDGCGVRFAENVSAPATTPSHDKLLDGLLSASFQESTCESRYKSSLYRKPSSLPLSPYLVKKLRERYRTAFKQLQAGRNADSSECKYVVWFPLNGLGNRMLAIASTFLYALLSGRVMLVNVPQEQEGLFCEPFPGTSWVLPDGFPEGNPMKLYAGAPESYVNMLKNNVIRYDTPASSLPAHVYLHLEQIGQRLSDNIFCDDDQRLLGKFGWMILKSDSYFAMALFLTPMYDKELARMFPYKEAVFHHLGRYLLHPTNRVWGIVRRCIKEQRLLPELGKAEPAANTSGDGKVKAVLITSLYSGYYDKIRGMYYENPTKTGEIVALYQPTHEEKQEYASNEHNQKALAEIYLLSYWDKIDMSAWSTFGFAGVKPWILLRPDWDKEVSQDTRKHSALFVHDEATP